MIDRYHDIPCNAANCYSLTNTHPLSPFIPRSTIPVIPVVLMPALLRHPLQPEYMVMSSSPVLRTRCLTGQLDAYSFTKRYFQALSSSPPSPKKALCRPPSQHVRARARGYLGGETRRRRFFWPATFLRCPSFLSSVFIFSHHPPTPPIQTPQPKPLFLFLSSPSPSPSFQSKFKFQIQKFNSPTSTSPTPHKPHSSPRLQLFSETPQISTPNVLSSPIVLGVASFRSSMCMRRGRRRLLSL